MLTCLHCGAEITNGLALCELCQAAARLSLEFLPVHFRNLARWRPGRSGTSRPVPGSRVLYDGTMRNADSTGDRIADRLDEVLTMLTTWARALTDDRTLVHPLTLADAVLAEDLSTEVAERLVDDPSEVVRLVCVGLDQHLTSMATLPWCGDLVQDLGRHEADLGRLTAVAIPGWYAGGCRDCGTGTYVVPGLTWVTCPVCGTTTAARDHLEVILDEARGWIAPPKRLAEAVVALVDGEQSVPRVYERIMKWAQRVPLTAHHQTERGYAYDDGLGRMVVVDQGVGRARYQFGEVLDQLRTREPKATRAAS